MKRTIITVTAALLASIPATMGFLGNATFSQRVPVRVPSNAAIMVADNGGRNAHVTTGDKSGHRPKVTVKVKAVDKSGSHTHLEPGDDRGGLRPHVQPGDDKGGLRPANPATVSASDSGKNRVKIEDGGGKHSGSGH